MSPVRRTCCKMFSDATIETFNPKNKNLLDTLEEYVHDFHLSQSKIYLLQLFRLKSVIMKRKRQNLIRDHNAAIV